MNLRRILVAFERDPRFETDRRATAILEFDRGPASFTAATQLTWYQLVSVLGTRGNWRQTVRPSSLAELAN